jgi:hypothetical protein
MVQYYDLKMLDDHSAEIRELLIYMSNNIDAQTRDLGYRVRRLERLLSNIILTGFCKYLGTDTEEAQKILISYLRADPSYPQDLAERIQEKAQ